MIDIPLDEDATDKLPPPPAWQPPPPGAPYDYEDAGDDPLLDEATTERTLDPTMALPAGAGAPSWKTTAAPVARSLARSAPAGLGKLHRRQKTWRTEHEDAWMLREYQAAGKHFRSGAEFQAERDRQAAELAGRSKALLVCSAAGVLLYGIAAWQWGLTFLFLSTVAIWALLCLSGWEPSGAPLPPGEHAPLPPLQRSTLDKEGVAKALRLAGIIKSDVQAAQLVTAGARPAPGGNGWKVDVTLPEGISARSVIKARHDVATGFDTEELLVHLEKLPGSNRRLSIWLADRDPLTGMTPRSVLCDVRQVNIWKGIPIGRTIRGELVKALIPGTHWLIAGTTRSGKSQSAGLIVLGYALDPRTQLLLLDPEGFGIWAPYAKIAEVIQGSERQAAMVDRLCRIVEVEMPRRQAEVARIQKETPARLATAQIDESISRDLDYNLPPLLIAIDEAHFLFRPGTPPELVKRATWAISQIIFRGAKYGISLVMATQKATDDSIPSDIRDIFTTRWLHACGSTAMADAAIPGWRDYGMDPMALQPAVAGQPGSGNSGAGYLWGNGLMEPADPRGWVLMRADFADRNDTLARIDDILETRRRIRPSCLPTPPKAEVEEPEVEPVPPAEQLPPADVRHLERLLAVFEPDEELDSPTIIERLKKDWPGQYEFLTPRGLNSFLEPWQLATTKIGPRDARRAGLRWRDVAARVSAMVSAECPMLVEPGCGLPADTASDAQKTTSDQGVSAASAVSAVAGQAPQMPEEDPWADCGFVGAVADTGSDTAR